MAPYPFNTPDFARPHARPLLVHRNFGHSFSPLCISGKFSKRCRHNAQPQALITLCRVHFWCWDNSLVSLSALWGNKNWPSSLKMWQMENGRNKKGRKGCKGSSLNASGTDFPLSHPFLSWENSLFSLLTLWAGMGKLLMKRNLVTNTVTFKWGTREL